MEDIQKYDDIQLRHSNAVYNQNTIDRWTKRCILTFTEKDDLGIAKNYRGITLTSKATKIYNALLDNRIELKIEKTFKKNQNRSTTSQILTAVEFSTVYVQKNLRPQYYSSTSPRPLTPYTEGRWSKYFFPTVSPKKLSQPYWCYIKHGSKSPLTGWRHRLLRHCSRCATKRHISPIHVYQLPRLRAENVYCFNERKVSSWQRKEAEDTPYKQLRTLTTPIT